MKYKTCTFKMVADSKEILIGLIDQIKKVNCFKEVKHNEIYPCTFEMGKLEGNVTDFRVVVSFVSKMSKNNIYFLLNEIYCGPTIKYS